jgi:hypothetical protein
MSFTCLAVVDVSLAEEADCPFAFRIEFDRVKPGIENFSYYSVCKSFLVHFLAPSAPVGICINEQGTE